MSEDLICADCGRPFSEHDEFREAVDERVEQKLAEHKYFTQLVAHKMSPDTVPKPRTESLDALEHARIKAFARQREIHDRAMRLVEEYHGIPVGTVPTPDERHAYFKDLRPDGVEYR